MSTVTDASPARVGDRRAWWRDVGVLALVTIALRVAGFLASRHLTFDDGQYGAVVLGLRDGDAPFRDLFSSQGPLFYPLLWAADLVGLRTLDGPRVLSMASGVVAAGAAYAIARRLATRTGALVAGLLVATSGSVLFVTTGLSGDGPALALALTAVSLALRFRADPSLVRAGVTGLAMGAACCVKLIVVPAAIPVGLALLARRKWTDLGLAVGVAVGVFLAAALPWGLERVWDQSIAYHQESERLRSYGGNAWTLVRTLAERDPFVVAALSLSAATLLFGARRGVHVVSDGRDGGEVPIRTAAWALGAWLAAQAAFLVAEPAMWRPHVSQVVAPLAVLAVLRPAPWRVIAVAVLVLGAWWVVNTDEMLFPGAYDRDEQAVVGRLRGLPDGAWVISDDPGFAWRTERRVPGNFVDVSQKRVQQRQLTARVIARAADDPRVCAVVVWSPARFGSLEALPARLAREGFEAVARYGGRRAVYERADCAP